MREINKISEALFEKIRDRYEDVSLGDENAMATQNPEDARFFNFDYIADGKNYGNITLSLIDETSLKVYFSKNISHDLDDAQRKDWYEFLKELREFAKRNLLSFEPRDITRSTLKHRDIKQVSKSDNTYDKDEVIGESRLYGTSRSSYENDGPVKIIIRHSDQINPEQRGSRSRKIRAMYLENVEGERRKLPFNNLKYARAMARHVSEGGSIDDEFGQHITNIAEECSKLRPFKSQMVRRTFEDAETQSMVEAAFEYHSLLNNTLKRMSGRKGYAACKESFQANEETLMDDFDVDSMRERFVRKTYNDATDSALPIVQKAYNMKKQNKFAQQFESWANNVAEEWDEEPIDVNELADLFADELPLGVDAVNAINAISGIINDNGLEEILLHSANENPEADAREIIMNWVYNNVPAVYQELMNEIGDVEPADQYESAEGDDDELEFDRDLDEPDQEYGSDLEFDQDRDSPDQFNREMNKGERGMSAEDLYNTIHNRIMQGLKQGQHGELLKKLGPDGLMDTMRGQAEFHAGADEWGSSDTSGIIRSIYRSAGLEFPELNEGKMKDIALDIEELSNKQFYAKYKMSKEAMKAKLAEGQGDDYVNRDEKMKRMGAKPLGMMDKLKNIPRGMKAMAKGDSEDDLVLYNKSMVTNEDTEFNEAIEQMRRIAGLK